MPRARSRSSASARLASLACLADELARALGVAVEALLGHPEVHRQRDQARLCAVVQVALDALQLGGGGVDRAGAVSVSRSTRAASEGPSSQRARCA